MRPRPNQFRQVLAPLLELFRQINVSPLVAEKFPLAEARKAHEVLAGGGVIGKIVLEVRSSH